MKGISPVITTVLLLLLAVASVGGAWVFVQRIQRTTTSAGSGQFEQIKGQTSSAVSVDSITVNDNGVLQNDTIAVKLANPSAGTSKLTRILVENATGSSLTNTTTLYINPNSFSNFLITVSNTTDVKKFCPTTTYLKITLYSDAFIPVRRYPIECKY